MHGIADYIHRTGWGNVAPDVREHWRQVLHTYGPASAFIHAGRHLAVPDTSGGRGFNDDRLRRTLGQHLSQPIVNALTGSGSTSVTDAIARSARQTPDTIVRVLGPKLDALLSVFSGLGINITIPASPGHPAQTFHELLKKPGAPVSHGNPSHPLRGGWQGFNR